MIEEKERPHGLPFRGGEKAANVDSAHFPHRGLQIRRQPFFTRFIASKSRRGSYDPPREAANAFAHRRKIALVSAAVIDEVPVSPIPPGASLHLHDVNLDRRVSLIRSIW